MISKIDRGLGHFKSPIRHWGLLRWQRSSDELPPSSHLPAAPGVGGGKGMIKESSVAGHICCQAPIGLHSRIMQLPVDVAS